MSLVLPTITINYLQSKISDNIFQQQEVSLIVCLTVQLCLVKYLDNRWTDKVLLIVKLLIGPGKVYLLYFVDSIINLCMHLILKWFLKNEVWYYKGRISIKVPKVYYVPKQYSVFKLCAINPYTILFRLINLICLLI